MNRKKAIYIVLIIFLSAAMALVLFLLTKSSAAISSGRAFRGNLIFHGMKKVEESKGKEVALQKSWSYENNSLLNEFFSTKDQVVLISPKGITVLSKDSGKELWRTETKPEVYEKHYEDYYDSQFGIVYKDRVFYNYDDNITVMKLKDGKGVQRIEAPDSSRYKFFAVSNNVMYVYCANTCIYAINLDNESIRWKLSTGSGQLIDMHLDKKILYYCSGEELSAVYTSSSQKKWSTEIKVKGYYPTKMISDEEKIYIFYNSSEVRGGMVRVFSKDKGKELWETAYEDWIYNQAAANGKLYLLAAVNNSNIGKLIILNAESGKAEVTKELNNEVYNQIALTKNYIYVVNNLGHILLLDSSTGEIKKQITFQNEIINTSMLIEDDSMIIGGMDEKEIKSNLKIIRLK